VSEIDLPTTQEGLRTTAFSRRATDRSKTVARQREAHFFSFQMGRFGHSSRSSSCAWRADA
jgi:hypothetical protein